MVEDKDLFNASEEDSLPVELLSITPREKRGASVYLNEIVGHHLGIKGDDRNLIVFLDPAGFIIVVNHRRLAAVLKESILERRGRVLQKIDDLNKARII